MLSNDVVFNSMNGPPLRNDPLDLLRSRSIQPSIPSPCPTPNGHAVSYSRYAQQTPGMTVKPTAPVVPYLPYRPGQENILTESTASARSTSRAGYRGFGRQSTTRIDSYRPTTPVSTPRDAAEVYVQASQPPGQKSDRILAAIESERLIKELIVLIVCRTEW